MKHPRSQPPEVPPNLHPEFFSDQEWRTLIENGRASVESEAGIDHVPVVKLFTPDANATWLLSEVMPHEPDIAFALCDLGLGSPELGYVSLQELSELRGALRLPVEKDLHFKPGKSLTSYAEEARVKGRI